MHFFKPKQAFFSLLFYFWVLRPKFTSAIETGALYEIGKNWEVDIRFKSLWVNCDKKTVGKQDKFTYDTASFGLIVGIIYRFLYELKGIVWQSWQTWNLSKHSWE